MLKNVIFLDRDGVINRKQPEGDYVKTWSEFEFLPNVLSTLADIYQKQYLIVIVTNQRCIARKIISLETLNYIHEQMCRQISAYGGFVTKIMVCPHDIIDNCPCRKPKSGLIESAILQLTNDGIGVDLAQSYMIGDSESDILAGIGAGLQTIKIGKTSCIATISVIDLAEAWKYVQSSCN